MNKYNLPLLVAFISIIGLGHGINAGEKIQLQLNSTLRARLPQLPLIGDQAPSFEAQTTQGSIRFPEDFKGKWVVLFSHPSDFTPVCTSEFILFGSMLPEFKRINTELLGLSIGSVKSHQEWIETIEKKISYLGIEKQKIEFPVIGDADGEIAWKFGMLHPHASQTKTVRAVFVIDPQGVIRSMLYYPPSHGRNISEIKRMVIALQTGDQHGVATPASWQPGENVMVPSVDEVGKGSKQPIVNPEGADCQAWFFCEKELEKSKLALP